MLAVRAAGFPDGASSRLPAEQHLVPGVQDHDDVGGGGVDQADGEHLQLLVDVPLELQGEEMQGVQARDQREAFFNSRDENENLSYSISHIETRTRIFVT